MKTKFSTAILAMFALAILVARPVLAAAAEKWIVCHADGQADTTHFSTLSLPWSAVLNHFNNDGSTKAGHEDDYFGACTTDATPTSMPTKEVTSTATTIASPTSEITQTVPATPTVILPTNTALPTTTALPTETGEVPTLVVEFTPTIPSTSITAIPTDTNIAPTPVVTSTLVLTPVTTPVVPGDGPGCEETWDNYNRITAAGRDASRWATRIQNQGWQTGCPVKLVATGAGDSNTFVLYAAILLAVIGFICWSVPTFFRKLEPVKVGK